MNEADFKKGFPGKLVKTSLAEYLNGPLQGERHARFIPMPPGVTQALNDKPAASRSQPIIHFQAVVGLIHQPDGVH